MKLTLPLLSLFFLASCAAWKPHYKYCSETNWESQGIIDGKKDLPLEVTFQKYKRKCAAFEKPEHRPNFTTYRYGHHLGVLSYCSFERGKEMALKENFTTINCLPKKHKDFFAGRERGIQEFCIYDKGFQFGLSGHNSARMCQVQKHPAFFKGIKKGIHQYCSYERGVKIGASGHISEPVCTGKDHPDYYQGIEVGLQKYCRFESGKKSGYNGESYTGNCPKTTEENFLRGFQIGKGDKERKNLNDKIQSLTQQIEDLRVRNGRYQERIKSLEKMLDARQADVEQLQLQLNKCSGGQKIQSE